MKCNCCIKAVILENILYCDSEDLGAACCNTAETLISANHFLWYFGCVRNTGLYLCMFMSVGVIVFNLNDISNVTIAVVVVLVL